MSDTAPFVLGNTRLAIVDPGENGNQPLVSRDGLAVCVFNGEIYNHRELLDEHRLTTTGGSDGAVIPELYRRYGVRGFGFLRGMFAVALLDLSRRRLVLARDQLGIKPLFWGRAGPGEVLFASEPRALAEVLGCTEVSAPALTDFLRDGHVAANRAPFVGVESLAPNEWIEFDGDSVVARGAVGQRDRVGPAASPEQLRHALLDTVRLHLRSDVPTALLLSSGVDSAALAWAVAGCGGSLRCFTVDVGGGRAESGAAEEIARRFGHRHVPVRRELGLADAWAFFRAMQRPTIDGLNTYLVCRVVAEHGIKVALSGLGGDEALAGYRHFRLLPWLRALTWLDRLPATVHRGLVAALPSVGPLAGSKAVELLGPEGPRDAAGLSRLQRRLFGPADVAALTGHAPAENDRTAEPGRSSVDLSLAEIRGYLQGMLLPDADTFSMASSVELRVPLVDVEFLRVALAVDRARGVGKRRFARILGDPLLRASAARPKQGFSLPMQRWLRAGVLAPFVDDLADPAAPVWRHLDPAVGRRVLTRWRRGGRWAEAWALVALNAWLVDLTARRLPRSAAERPACAG
jgi:asparagine synthase (glutamine-hydrolysing)